MSGNWHKRGNLRGASGVGVPEGGQPGQMLQKVGSSDYATGWAFPEYKDILGKVPKSALPDIGNSTQVVGSESAMLNLPAVAGNMVIRTDAGRTFVLAEEPANRLENWVELVTSSDVQSVNGKTGNVTLTKSDVGLSNVNNTADADKPVATASVNGLLSKADKSKLDKSTANATANTIVLRDSAGKTKLKGATIETAPTANTDATTKAYVDAQVSSVAGGSVLSDTDWDAMRTTPSTGVVEGFVKGCPVGGKINTTYNMSAGFVKDPVWRLEVRPEGLNYVTQRATLLSSTPRYMVGFAWERIYNPAESKWGSWVCVAGDTGPLYSTNSTDGAAGVEYALRVVDSTNTYPYTTGVMPWIRNVSGMVQIAGAMRSKSSSLSTAEGVAFGALLLNDTTSANHPGVDYTFTPCQMGNMGVQQGTGNARWHMRIDDRRTLMASRYDLTINSSGVWLPFSVEYGAEPLNTYTGAGFTPPPLVGAS